VVSIIFAKCPYYALFILFGECCQHVFVLHAIYDSLMYMWPTHWNRSLRILSEIWDD